MQIRGTYGTIYYTANMQRSVEFYKKVFEKEPTHASDGWTEFDCGGHNLCLHWQDSKEPVKSSKTCLIVSVRGLDGIIQKLRKQDMRMSDKHEVHPGAYSADLTDPDGHILSFYENTNA